MSEYRRKLESVIAAADAYDEACMREPMRPIYRFGEAMIEEEAIEIDANQVRLPGFERPVDLDLPNRYGDMV